MTSMTRAEGYAAIVRAVDRRSAARMTSAVRSGFIIVPYSPSIAADSMADSRAQVAGSERFP